MRRSLIITALPVLAALALVLALPFLLRPKENLLAEADETLVIVSPHNEAIRYEFSRGFAEFYKHTTGKTVRIDWRLIGGASDIAKYLKGEYVTAFRNEWTASGKAWNKTVENAFDNSRIIPAEDPVDDTPEQAARRAFLESDAGIGIDLFFGGGSYDFIQQANAGRLVDCGLIPRMPEVFREASLPRMVSGEPFYDEGGRWIGACVSAFGICYNTHSLRRLGIQELPASWKDLTDPAFRGQVALADPTKSGSAAKAFEMIIQQQMQECVASSERNTPDAGMEQAVADGWLRGLQIIQKASANARYFTDSAGNVPVDVAQGNAAIGMCIDFYGRFQSEAIRTDEGISRLRYFTPHNGSSIGADPIALLRGAPHRDLAVRFMEYVISIQGQKLWNFRVGTPGGPVKYALRRLPIRRELYEPFYRPLRSDPAVDPYQEAEGFIYHPEWTAPLFSVLRLIIQASCIDSHDEQAAAWKALIAADFPAEASAVFSDFSSVDYLTAMQKLRPVVSSGDRLAQVQLAGMLGEHFRKQYRLALQLAEKARQENPGGSPKE